MTAFEITLAQAYLAKSRQDPVAALIRSVRDLAAMRRMMAVRRDLDAPPIEGSLPSGDPRDDGLSATPHQSGRTGTHVDAHCTIMV